MANRVPVEALMDAPEGMVRRGDEFIDPSEYVCCRECRTECRRSAETCISCGEPLVE